VGVKELFTILFLSCFFAVDAQNFSNFKTKFVSTQSDTVLLDTLSIVAASFQIKDTTLQISYTLIDDKGLLVWKNRKNLPDSIEVRFETFPFLLSKQYYHKSLKQIQLASNNFTNPFTFQYQKPNNDIFKMEGLNRSGSITRGVTFGNNQDVVVNSNLNLQLSGKISETINIKAAIADDNIPIQPEGNTQQLQEFDKVYIQLNDEKSQLVAGDFILNKPPSYFMNYFKRNQGGSFNTSFKQANNKNNTHSIDASAAVSKGKFSRNIILGIEGNQGPYRLKGAENESFIIVLSGSENIYIDGKLLQRGQENDYIIDYNTAQITFTAKRIITKDKRIVAEFQYVDRNYARSIITFGHDFTNGKFQSRMHVYTEQDNKNKPVNLILSDSQKEILRSVGDSINYALAPSIDTVDFSSIQVLYQAQDTIVNGITYTKIFVYSTNPARAIYRPTFSNVGQGNGNYININSSANGKVYQWVAPVNGIKQGNYEPLVLLPTPKQRQMAIASTAYQINKNLKTGVELAISNYDVNTFSPIGNANNQGYGVKYFIDGKTPLKDTTKALSLITIGSYEMISKGFTQIERFRSVEFERDWNRNSNSINNIQQLASLGLGIEKEKRFKALYKFNTFNEQKNYNGQQHMLNSFYDKNGLKGSFDASLLSSKSINNNTVFLRQKGGLTKSLSKRNIVLGVFEEQEKSSFKALEDDSLLNNSFHYFEWQAFANNSDSAKTTYELKYINRTDWLPKDNVFKMASVGQSYIFSTGFSPSAGSTFKNTSTYRILDIKDTTLITQNADKSLVNRIEYSLRLLKGSINLSTFYELGSGLEVKKEYSFIEVAPGQGSYTWKDYNENGIKELNEFEIAVFTDQAKYLKVFTPTNEFVKTFNNQFNQLININAPAKWGTQKNTIKKVISRFSNQTAYRIDRKTADSKLEDSFNPFNNLNFDSTLVSLNSNLRSTFYFNRLDPKFGLDYTYQEPRNRQLLTNGFESRSNKSNAIRFRYNITRVFQLSAEVLKGLKINKSEYFNTRDFNIIYSEVEPKFTYQPNVAFKLILSFKYVEKINNYNDSNNVVLNNNYGAELRFNEAGKGSFSAKINYIKINYNSDPNSSVAFEMLDGLVPGNNITWNIGYQRTLANNMQVNFNYDGRKTEGNKTIHTGGVTVRAFF
jgi:hypothetical protein